MMGACMRSGLGVSLGISVLIVAVPACLMLMWVAMGCMWVVGLVSVMKLVWRLLWRSMRRSGRCKRKEEAENERRLRQKVVVKEEEEEMRLSLFHQYLEDQLNTLAQQLLHVYGSDSVPGSHVDLPVYVDFGDWAAVDDQDSAQDKLS